MSSLITRRKHAHERIFWAGRTDLKVSQVELAVDANRDGTIEKGETASKEKPFRFWLNRDVDVQRGDNVDKAEDVEPAIGVVKNCDDNIINGVRDLEDFSRLKIFIGRDYEKIVSGEQKIGLKWKDTGGTNPSLKIWPNLSADSTARKYLTDVDVGLQHLSLYEPVLIKGSTVSIIPAHFWTHFELNESRPYLNLIFEGCTSGKGQLVPVVLNSDGTVMAECPGGWIELKVINQLYEHWTAGDNVTRGFKMPATAGHPRDNTFEYSSGDDGLSDPDSPDYNGYALFVHGWRMMPWERRYYAETSLKRMYHQGYKGKFGFFSWPTEWVNLDDPWTQPYFFETANGLLKKLGLLYHVVDDPGNYNRSEEQARKAGAGPLHSLLVNLGTRFAPGSDRVRVFAHSMGNVVLSEALRVHPENTPLIRSYVACQSAEVAHAFDRGAKIVDLSEIIPTTTLTVATADEFSADTISIPLDVPNIEGIRNYTKHYKHPDLYSYDQSVSGRTKSTESGKPYYSGLGSRTKVGKFANFVNQGDYALGNWDLNQALKPTRGYFWQWKYIYNCDMYFTPEFLHLNWPKDSFAILPHIIAARSRSTGAAENLEGEFDPSREVNFKESFKDDHSGQFLSNFARRREFYFKLLENFAFAREAL